MYAHRDALTAMVSLWSDSPMYSYGFTVPVISAVLVWTRCRRGRADAAAVALGRQCLLAASLVLAVLGRAGGVQVLDHFAFLFALAASVLILFGRGISRWRAPRSPTCCS